MTFTSRPVKDESDFFGMHNLVMQFPQQNLHTVDLRYRLSSPAVFTEPEKDIRLWEDEAGNLIGWAIRQFPFSTLDLAYDPSARQQGIEETMLQWGVTRCAEAGVEQGRGIPYWVVAKEDDKEMIALLERSGFANTGWLGLHMMRSLDESIAEATLPEGFTVRPLAGEDEVMSYVEVHRAAFGTENMDPFWRMTTLRAPGYVADLDLVAVSREGRVVGAAIGWLGMDAREAQFEPVAVHPDYQRRGLGRAMLTEGLKRMKACGAERALIDVDEDNDAAGTLYEKLGFKTSYRMLIFVRSSRPEAK